MTIRDDGPQSSRDRALEDSQEGADSGQMVDERDDPIVLRNMARVMKDSMAFGAADREFLISLAENIEHDYAHGFKHAQEGAAQPVACAACPTCGALPIDKNGKFWPYAHPEAADPFPHTPPTDAEEGL